MSATQKLGRVLLVGALLFFTTLAGLAFGALSGALVAVMAPGTVRAGFALLGLAIEPGQFYQVGAALGWAGGFLRSIHLPEGT